MTTASSSPPRERPPFARWMRQGNDITQQFLALAGRTDLVVLSGGLPAKELFPVDEVAAAAQRALTGMGGDALGYGPVEGVQALREAIAQRFTTPRLQLGAENILITTGSMQGLELLGKCLIDEGDVVATERPTYLGALDAWLPRQPRYAELLTGKGNGNLARLQDARFVYVMPNFANPTGAVLGLSARKSLLRAIGRTGGWLIEDDPYEALRYEGEALPTLIELSSRSGERPYEGPVVHLGTLSKTTAPGLRLGWVVAAPAMIRALARAKQGSDLSTSTLCQATALELIAAEAERRHVPTFVAAYRERRDALCAAADVSLTAHFTWSVPSGAMFVWLTARDERVDTDALLPVALRHGVAFVPGSAFDPEGRPSRALRLNFTANSPDRIREGVRRLAQAVATLPPALAAAE